MSGIQVIPEHITLCAHPSSSTMTQRVEDLQVVLKALQNSHQSNRMRMYIILSFTKQPSVRAHEDLRNLMLGVYIRYHLRQGRAQNTERATHHNINTGIATHHLKGDTGCPNVWRARALDCSLDSIASKIARDTPLP
eukprot:1160289-Pelagomonas_calceolata.AAC.3